MTTLPSKWPGVDNLVALLTREKDEEAPQLRLLLAETLFAVGASVLVDFVVPSFNRNLLVVLRLYLLESIVSGHDVTLFLCVYSV